jgi:hypothetical protein
MGVSRLAGLPGQRHGGAAQDGCRPNLCQTLCLVHAGWNRWRGRPGCSAVRSATSSCAACAPMSASARQAWITFGPSGCSAVARTICGKTSNGQSEAFSPSATRRLRSLTAAGGASETDPSPGIAETQTSAAKQAAAATPKNDAPRPIDKSALAIAEPRRYRNKEHLRFVAQRACLVCGRKPSDPHHLRFTQPRALGRKVSDEFVAPLCRIHHREVHRVGDERAWWKRAGIDPVKVARKLWRKTRLNEGSRRSSPRLEPTGLDPASKSNGVASKPS